MERKRVMGSRAGIKEALSALRRGGVIVYPTETFYALGADPRKRSALKKLRRLKGRESSKPLLLIASSRRQALSLVQAPHSRRLRALTRRFWPGPLTLILPPKNSGLSRSLGRSDGLALRLTSQPLARRLIRSFGFPITGTSANPTGCAPARRAARAAGSFRSDLDGILDGGHTHGGKASTLVDLTGSPPILRRAGPISLSALRSVVPDVTPASGHSPRWHRRASRRPKRA